MDIQPSGLPRSAALQPKRAEIGLRSVSALTPPYVYSNDEIAKALDLPALPRVCRRIGIEKRRTFVQLDLPTGKTLGTFDDLELELAERVANKAIAAAGVSRESISVLCFISCTVQKGRRIHFELSSHELVQRLRLARTVHRFEIDAGCDGFVHALHTINSLFKLEPGTNALIVATSIASVYFGRDQNEGLPNVALFPNYVFGDGAAAAVVSAAKDATGVIRATYGECDSTVHIGSTMMHASGKGDAHVAYIVDYEQVNASYVPAIVRAVSGLNTQCPAVETIDFDRVYFHQANGVLPQAAAQKLGISLDRLPIGARNDGNTASACIPTLIARELESRTICKGSRILLGAVGAGMACSAAYIEF